MNFHFRPTTPIIQYDSTVSGSTAGLPYEDREQNIRTQSVTIYVELHGHRFITDQDIVRAGAFSRD